MDVQSGNGHTDGRQTVIIMLSARRPKRNKRIFELLERTAVCRH